MEIKVAFQDHAFIRRIQMMLWSLVAISMLMGFVLGYGIARAEEGTASWYSVESCLREGTSGIMANGEALDDNKLTCAMWGVPFGTRLLVTNLANGKKIIVVVKDRGPSKRLYKKGRIVDLSKLAFSRIAELKRGLIQVSVEVVQ